MGYTQTGLRSGFTATGTAFFPISGTGIPLTSFTFETDDLYGTDHDAFHERNDHRRHTVRRSDSA